MKLKNLTIWILCLLMIVPHFQTIQVQAATSYGTSFSEMLARAEEMVNYEWTPSSRIYTWNNSTYNGKKYFEAGQKVKGMPYTLFSWELEVDSLLSFAQFKNKVGANYSTTAYCNSTGSNRTGPAYGSCCATFVSNVFGGNFMNGDSPRYDSVRNIRSSSYGTTTEYVKLSDVKLGDALSYVSSGGNHIIWVGGITDSTITIYEQTPPVARKVVINKSSVNSNGYLVYGGKVYHTVTRSNGYTPDVCSCSESYKGNYTCTTTSSNLMIRSGHGSEYDFVGRIPSGATVCVTKANGQWAHVEYNGVSGYASMEYLKKIEEKPTITGISISSLPSKTTYNLNESLNISGLKVKVSYSNGTSKELTSGFNVGSFNSSTVGTKSITVSYEGKSTSFNVEVVNTVYTISLDANGGINNDVKSIKQSHNQAITIPSNMNVSKPLTVTFELTVNGDTESVKKTIYAELSSWNTSSSGNGETILLGSSYMPNKNMTLYASYGLALIGDVPSFSTNLEGYEIEGWYLKTPFGISDMELTPTVSTSSDTTVVAVLKEKEYTVHYDMNGGIGDIPNQTKKYSSGLTLSSSQPERENYQFLGWSLNQDAKEASYHPGDLFSMNANVTLYAVWKEKVTIKNISIIQAPTKTIYEVGEPLDTTGLKLNIEYSNGTSVEVTNEFTTSGYDSSKVGKQIVTVSYDGKSTSFEVTVKEAKLPETDANIKVNSVSGIRGNEVEVQISLENNPGVMSMTFEVHYDKKVLQLLEVVDSGKLGASVHSDNLNASPYQLTWANDLATQDYKVNDSIATLRFKILENAELGDTQIHVSYDVDNYDIVNANLEPVLFNTIDGSVNVTKVLCGDVNEDGKVNTLDRMIITRYLAKWTGYGEDSLNLTAADVNGDGKVNTLDRMIITRYLAKWTGYESLPHK